MREVLEELQEWSEAGERIAVATVVRTRRSAPRPPGAKMAINERSEIAGAVSGGCVEGAVAEAALDLLRGGSGPRMLSFGIADSEAWDVGLPCGGEIDVFVEGHDAMSDASPQAELARLASEGARGALATVVGPEGHPEIGRKLLVREDGSISGGLGADALDEAAGAAGEELLWAERSELRELEGAEVFFEVVGPAPRIFVLGAVDYTAALCKLADATGWRPYVCDPRTAFATRDRFPEAEEVIAAWPDRAFERRQHRPRDLHRRPAHDAKLDDAALRIALRSEAAYVGAMGGRCAPGGPPRAAGRRGSPRPSSSVSRRRSASTWEQPAPRRRRSRSSPRWSRSETTGRAGGAVQLQRADPPRP
ncbi:MAG: XdhC family protein [Solirubrobacterales bacterium]